MGLKGTKVLFSTASLDLGGAEKQLYLLMRELTARGLSCELVAFRDGPWRAPTEALGVKVTILNSRSRVGKILAAFKFLRQSEAEVLHTFGASAGYIFRIAAIFSHIRVVVSSERYAPVEKNRLQRLAERVLGPWTTHLICNSGHAAHFYVSEGILPAERVSVVLNGIEDERHEITTSPPAPQKPLTLGYLANLYPKKNHSYLLAVLKNLTAMGMSVRCHFGGEGPLRHELEREASSLGLSDVAVFHGKISDRDAFFDALDMYLHFSLHEGLPNAVMEAMIRGLPCIVTANPGNQELIRNEIEGLVVHLDQPRTVATQIAALWRDETRREKFSRAARQRILSELSVSKMVDSTLAVYRKYSRMLSSAVPQGN